MSMVSVVITMAVVAVALIWSAAFAQDDNPVSRIKLPLLFPAVGNLDKVRLWQFGRLEGAQQATARTDVTLTIRTVDGLSVRVTGPTAILEELARQSNWVTTDQSHVGRTNWVERQIAFDADENNRIIAIASLEPISRNRNRLRRAICSRGR